MHIYSLSRVVVSRIYMFCWSAFTLNGQTVYIEFQRHVDLSERHNIVLTRHALHDYCVWVSISIWLKLSHEPNVGIGHLRLGS